MAGKRILVMVSPQDLVTLKNGNYSLCFAKFVNGTANVVWQAFDPQQWLENNVFEWEPAYQVYGARPFRGWEQVASTTPPLAIGLDCTSVLDKNGSFSPATPGGQASSVTIDNQFSPITLGLSQTACGSPAPIYVSPEPAAASGAFVLTPVERILVWFDQQLTTSTMFTQDDVMGAVLDMTGIDDATLLYMNGTWYCQAPLVWVGDPA